MNDKERKMLIKTGDIIEPSLEWGSKYADEIAYGGTPYQDEETAYRAYIVAYDAKPWSEKKEKETFQAWLNLWSQLRKQDRALLLVERIAERYPPDFFLRDRDYGWISCMFCGSDKGEQHRSDCIAVLIQGFKQ